MKRPFEQNNWFKTVGLFVLQRGKGFVSPDGKRFFQPGSVSAENEIVKIPVFYPQSFPGIKCGERLRGAERSNGQQAFVDNSERVIHFLLVLFTYRNLEIFIRAQFVRYMDYGFKMKCRVFHIDIEYSVHPDRVVIVPFLLRLDQGDKNVNIGTHAAGRFKFKERGTCCRFYAADVPESTSVFQTDNGYSFLGRRNADTYLFAGFIRFLIGREVEHGCCLSVVIFRPGAEIGYFACTVARCFVGCQDIIATVAADIQIDGKITVDSFDILFKNQIVIRAVDIGARGIILRIPPPAPGCLIDPDIDCSLCICFLTQRIDNHTA